MIGTKGLKRGDVEVTYFSDQVIGLFLPGGKNEKKEEGAFDASSIPSYNFFINSISPLGCDIVGVCDGNISSPYLKWSTYDIKWHVDNLLKNVANDYVESSDVTASKLLSPYRNNDSLIILIFFSSLPSINIYLKLMFRDVFYR